jgi:hypothetical protein
LLCCVTVAAGVVPDSEGAEASLRDVLAAALDANREMARLAAVLREENARLRAENAEQAAELERVRADLAVLQRMAFGRSSERARPEPSADCSCRVPATVTAPGPPKAIGEGLFTNAFIAMLFTERFVAGRSMSSLVTGLARHGADVAPGTLAGACAQAGALLAPLEDAI